MRVLRFSFCLFLVAACGGSSAPTASQPPAPDASAPAPAAESCKEGATRCDGTQVSTCEGTWSAPVECPGDQSCRNGTCQEPTADMRSQAKSVAALLDTLGTSSAWHEPVDIEGAKARERRAILKGDGSDATFFGAAWRAMNDVPQGHQGLFASPEVCGDALPLQSTSRFGVCGRPSTAGIAVTVAKKGNPLGLRVGDVVVKAGADDGDALFEAAYLRAVCGAVFPAKSGRRYAGAASFFGNVPRGTKLTVKSVDGATREVDVPEEGDGVTTDCLDPFGRSQRIYAEATKRPDGVAVIRLPSFLPYDKQLPTDPTLIDAFVADYQQKLVAIFDTVKDAPAIIWDARANTGGITPVALAIVGGFPTAKATSISYCRTRVAGSSPPAYEADHYAIYDVTPGGPFAYTGKVAVVTDGLAYSAGDYFPLAASAASTALVVGSSSAGAYGGGRAPIDIVGPPSMTANYDPTACFLASNDSPLEGAPPSPRVAVEYDPKDLAEGRDTIIERAVKELGF